MKFRAVSDQTRMNVMLWSIKQEIRKENRYLQSLPYDPMPIMEIVKQHIDRWDPIKLLAMDCPDDEYDGETRTITIYITKHLDDMDALSLGKAIVRDPSAAGWRTGCTAGILPRRIGVGENR